MIEIICLLFVDGNNVMNEVILELEREKMWLWDFLWLFIGIGKYRVMWWLMIYLLESIVDCVNIWVCLIYFFRLIDWDKYFEGWKWVENEVLLKW